MSEFIVVLEGENEIEIEYRLISKGKDMRITGSGFGDCEPPEDPEYEIIDWNLIDGYPDQFNKHTEHSIKRLLCENI